MTPIVFLPRPSAFPLTSSQHRVLSSLPSTNYQSENTLHLQEYPHHTFEGGLQTNMDSISIQRDRLRQGLTRFREIRAKMDAHDSALEARKTSLMEPCSPPAFAARLGQLEPCSPPAFATRQGQINSGTWQVTSAPGNRTPSTNLHRQHRTDRAATRYTEDTRTVVGHAPATSAWRGNGNYRWEPVGSGFARQIVGHGDGGGRWEPVAPGFVRRIGGRGSRGGGASVVDEGSQRWFGSDGSLSGRAVPNESAVNSVHEEESPNNLTPTTTPSHQPIPSQTNNQHQPHPSHTPKPPAAFPPYDLPTLAGMAILASPDFIRTTAQICDWIARHFPYYANRGIDTGSKNNSHVYLRNAIRKSDWFVRHTGLARDAWWSVNPGKGVTEMLLRKLRGLQGGLVECADEEEGDDNRGMVIIEDDDEEEERENGIEDDPRKHSCTSCASNYAHSLDLVHHVSSDHSPPRLLCCPDCTWKTYTVTMLRRHAKLTGHHSFKCSDCELVFSEADLLAHAKVSGHSIDRRYASYLKSCGECGKAFNAMGNLKRHVRESGHMCA